MIKAILKYLLPLGVVLLACFGQLTTQAPAGSAYLSPGNQPAWSVKASLAQVQLHPFFLIKAAEPGTRKASEIVAAVEQEAEEEEESISSKKYLDTSIFLTAVLSGQELGYFFSPLKKYLAFCKSFSYFSSHRWYLLFRVFRV